MTTPYYETNDAALPAVGITTPHAAAGLVIGAIIALALLRRGFRGVSVGGVSVGIK